ncbi:MAG: NADAR domain-containing protein [Candidatus Methylumidiphilus sp.]
MSLSAKKDPAFAANFGEYRRTVLETIRSNLKLAKMNSYFRRKDGVFSSKNIHNSFTITGALQTECLETLCETAPFFRRSQTRYLQKGSKYILRGKRYLAAIDPGLSVPQMLNIYREDLHDSFAFLERIENVDPLNQYKIVSPILDYAKNSVLTITNAFLHNEKEGTADFDDPSYLELRRDLVYASKQVTAAFYSSLLGKLRHDGELSSLLNIMSVIDKAHFRMIKEYKERRLSSREFVRPEASHPLILMAFCAVLLDRERADTIVGLPSGSTELACLLSEALRQTNNEECQLILLPFSMHSMKVQYGKASDKHGLSRLYEKCYSDIKLGSNILLVDDNSSSGATVDAVRTFLVGVSPESEIKVGVAEAELRRTELDMTDFNKRTHYATTQVYRHSVNVLPVARRLWRKHDLKEVSESFSVAEHYANAGRLNNVLRLRVSFEVNAEAAKHPFARRAAEPEWKDTKRIESFRDTFLSNFWQVKISYKGENFSSVEHAYQWSKFDLNRLTSIETSLREEISKQLGKDNIDLPGIFYSSEKSGIIKKLAEILTERGFLRDNWDDIRVEKMIDLTLRKYSDHTLRNELLSTSSIYLLEGNDWGDVFWGACKEGDKYRGRNMLGLILMNVRDKIRNAEF